MEDILADREQWVAIEHGMIPSSMSNEDWEKLNRKSCSTIRLFLEDLVLLNVLGENTTKNLWDKLGNSYQS